VKLHIDLYRVGGDEKEFIINDVDADMNDFMGRSFIMDLDVDCIHETYYVRMRCCRLILEKYGISESEYDEVAYLLEGILNFGREPYV